MPIKKFRPVTPARRFRSVSTFDDVTRKEPERSLTEGLSKKAGRNHHGRITMRRRGGGHKRRYRRIDFRRDKDGIPARVAHVVEFAIVMSVPPSDIQALSPSTRPEPTASE